MAGAGDIWALATTGGESDESQLSWVAIRVNTPSFYSEPEQPRRATVTRIKAVRTPIAAQLGWLAEFYDQHSHASTAEEIFPLISGIGEMFQNKQYGAVDRVLSEAELATLSPTVMITLVRTTYPARKKLDHWSTAVEAVKDQLDSQGLDAKRLLRGLV